MRTGVGESKSGAYLGVSTAAAAAATAGAEAEGHGCGHSGARRSRPPSWESSVAALLLTARPHDGAPHGPPAGAQLARSWCPGRAGSPWRPPPAEPAP